jgi:hypothetical protein
MAGRLLVTLVWLVLLGAVLIWPALSESPTLGDDLIRYTIRLALLYYAIALTLLLWCKPADWKGFSAKVRLARSCWTIAWLTYLVHLAMAFHYAHDWSHADAMRHTEEVSGFGPGIFVSHLFTLVWTLDVLSWWLRPEWYATRSIWIDRILHGFMLFVVFNGTVVFEQGLIRWAGALMFAWLGAVALLRLRRAGGVSAPSNSSVDS